MIFFERDLSYALDGTTHYKWSLIHTKLGNKPIIIEAKDLGELYEKKNRAKKILNNEWSKVQLKKEYEKLEDKRINLLNRALTDAQSLKWENIIIPMRIFSTEIIKYDDKFKPIGYFICGKNGEKFNIINDKRHFSEREPLAPENKFIQRFLYNLFGLTEDLYKLDNEFYRENQKYIENIKRYNRFKKEEEVWDLKYQETYENRLKKYYLKNPNFIEKQSFNLLVKSSMHHSYKELYKNNFFRYELNSKKIIFIYFLPTDDILQEYLKEPDYDKLEWKECTQEEKKKRKELIWSQLMLLAISEQFKADKFLLIETIFLCSLAYELDTVTGNYEWKRIKDVELSRKDYDKLNFNNLNPIHCINHYLKKEYHRQEEKNNLLEIKNHLSNMEKNIINSVEDIPYDIDIQPSINTNIETLNNNSGGIVNLGK